ncbi:MAG: nicotinamide mononucleotide transporter [Flavisolibacter sp.]|nr:nicotinamide mononucleotide transporter [Flavisolibacter sp.]
MTELYQQFIEGLKQTMLLEYIAVFAGIASVWFSKKENIWVYPVGLINTIIYIYLSFKYHLIGEASVNFYYTVMSIYGWVLWARKDQKHRLVLHITYANRKEWMQHLLFFAAFYVVIYFSLSYLKNLFASGAIPWADAFASATAYTGMWLMAKKKVESWIWWILTNIASIPLYFVKGLVFTSVYYVVLLVLAVLGLLEWKSRATIAEQSLQPLLADEKDRHHRT